MSSAKERKELIKKLKSDKKQICSQLDRFLDFVSKCNEFSNKINLNERYVKCETLWDNFDKVQIELEYLEESEKEDRHIFEEKYFETICKFKDLLINVSQSTNSISNQVNSVQHNFVKLPPLDLPTFCGNYDAWVGFYDSFYSLIHNNGSLDNVQKFYYLKSCLKGEAAQVIHSIEINNTNYEVAFNLLRQRYENKRFIIQTHVKGLYDLPVVGKNVLSDLRNLSDNIQKHIRALKVLNEPVDSWDTLLLYIFSNKLDNNSKREWETVCVKKNIITYNDFLSFLTERCHILENLESYNHQPQVSANSIKQQHFKGKSFISVDNNNGNNENKNMCPTCKIDRHHLYHCSKFLSFTPRERINEVKKLHLCLNCFKATHVSTRCSFKGCHKCGKPHNTLLHIDFYKQVSESNWDKNNTLQNSSEIISMKNSTENKDVSTVSVNISSDSVCHSSVCHSGEVLLSTAVVIVSDSNGNFHEVRALLDSGSQSNFITSELVSKLKLNTSDVTMSVSGINSAVTRSSKAVSVAVKSKFNAFSVDLNFYVLDRITSKLPTLPINVKNLNIPSNIHLADPNFYIPNKIDLLLGVNIFYELLLIGQIKTSENMPILQKTRLGWVISGNVPSENRILTKHSDSLRTTCNFVKYDNIDVQIEKFWKIEEFENRKFLKAEEQECEELFEKTTIHDSDGKFIVELPTKEGIDNLGQSREIAEKRFYKLERKLGLNEDLKNEYGKFMKEYEELGHMSEIPESELENSHPQYYMPHHGVLKDSTTTKLRVVFDASAKTDNGLSLNDKLKTGPSIQDDLFSILIRFRQHNIVLGADVEKMYRQVWIKQDQRDLQRIVWRPSPGVPLKHYRMNTITYGTAPASFLATRCLHKAAEEQESLFPRASNEIKGNFYVDDLLTGGATIEEVMKLKEDISEVLQKSGFILRKWVSNNKEVLKYEKKNNITQYVVDKDVTKTLGLIWNIQNDVLQYTIKVEGHLRPTKRNILSTVSKIFDPLGLVGPIITRAKIIMQKLWKNKMEWDDEIPSNLYKLWIEFYNDLPLLNNLNIKRHVFCFEAVQIDIIGFCDASDQAYGACLYARAVDKHGNIITNILCAKSKVAPIKTLTVPRLELCGALLLSRLIYKAIPALNISVNQIYCYTDSKIVLAWLNSEPGTWSVFVAHRVAEIQQNKFINDWNHVVSEQNPSDLVSRGCSVEQLINSELWWYGPGWLSKDKNKWPKDKTCIPDSNQTIPEQRITRHVHLIINDLNMFLRFSSFLKLQRVIAYCLRFYSNLKLNKNERKSGCLTIDELKHSLFVLLKISQNFDFSSEIEDLKNGKPISRKSKLLPLNPFLDKNQILRVGGRINKASVSYDQRCPIILNSKGFLAKLIIVYEHRKNLHMGSQNLLANIRSRFWILGGLRVIKGELRKCIICFRAKPRDMSILMGELPEQRLLPAKPFYNCGVDYAGPFSIKSSMLRKSKILKAYLCVFVCFVTRAVHYEIVSDMTTSSFLNALKRFIARRGKCKNMYSDCGSNFQGANNEMREFFKFLKDNKLRNEIVEYLSQDNITWSFIPPRSPHFGALWESSVRMAKYHLSRIVGNTPLTFEELSTVFTQIEACLNSRPLSPLSDDPNDLSPLTPGHFLVGESLTALPESDVRDVNSNRLSRYHLMKIMVQSFWDRWSKECLNELNKRSKWKYSTDSNVKIGNLVVLKDENLPPLKWSMGRIEELYPGSDGIVRVVRVKTQRGSFKRAVAKLCVLPLD